MSNLDVTSYNRLGQLYTAANQAAATVTLINTSTATGFILSNPFGSGKKLIVVNLCFTYTTAPTAIATVWVAGSVAPSPTARATVTALGVYGADGSGLSGVAVGRAYNASTTPNLPVYLYQLGNPQVTIAGSAPVTWPLTLEGSIILVPGSYIQTSYIGQAPVGQTSAVWAEVNV